MSPRWRFAVLCAIATALFTGGLLFVKNRERNITIHAENRANATLITAIPVETTGDSSPGARPPSARVMPSTAADAVRHPDAPPPAIAPFDDIQARSYQQQWADYLKLPLEYKNSIGMQFILIPPGEFTMGSTPEEIEQALSNAGDDKFRQDCINSEGPQHTVVLTRPFYIAIHEVTQEEYQAVMGINPSYFAKTGPNPQWAEKVADLDTTHHPVEGVSWNDAAEFCATLSTHEGLQPFYSRTGETVSALKGTGYRLPTEAEWEFACRGGTTTRFWNGDELPAGWFAHNSGNRTHEVEELDENPFGLFDVHGNVWEWVEDGWQPTYYSTFAEKPAIDPKLAFSTASLRVLRGGACFGDSHCRSSGRRAVAPATRPVVIGFRVALVPEGVRDPR